MREKRGNGCRLSLCLAFGWALGACSEDDTTQESSDDSSTGVETDGTSGSSTTDPSTSTSTSTDATDGSGGGSTGGDAPPQSVADCFADEFVGPAPLPNYDQFDVQPGSHCAGSNHQDILDVERVVFLGDSVTVGTPPTVTRDFYRNRLAEALVDRFALDPGAQFESWKSANLIDGMSGVVNSGALWSCAEWGGRNDDLLGGQLESCFPPETRDQKTLVVITMGGNDLMSFAQDLAEGIPYADVAADAEQMVADKRAAIEWMLDTDRFPAGNDIVFSNVYEFTDGTTDFLSCPLATTVGFDMPLEDPTEALLIVGYIEEAYAKMAAETGIDFIFMFENFCGHGFHSDDPDSLCYRGPGNENWFDSTCIHPNPTGHGVIADMFLAVIDE